mmetsp:Transcript_10157/g.18511  ORF Transcript_10157/g.18511 Transcript_10157/m.18511 type:complete len:3701 (+) Transcript_10157:26-11128(+)
MAALRALLAVFLLHQAALVNSQVRKTGKVRDFPAAFFTSGGGKSTTSSNTGTKDGDRNFKFTVNNYADWFQTDPEQPFNTFPHSLEFTQSGNTLQFASSSFYPNNGAGYGEQGTGYFTFEMDIIVKTTSSMDVTMGATCSMWVGRCAENVCTTLASWLNVAQTSTAGIQYKTVTIPSGTTRIWVAYAHHCQATPAIQIQIPKVSLRESPCDVSMAGVVYKSIYPLNGNNLNRRNTANQAADKIYLMQSSQADIQTAVWHSTQLDLKRGFMTSFMFSPTSLSVNGGGSYSGFALVIQSSNAQAQGDAGERHFDGIEKGLAIEVAFTSSTQAQLKIEHRYDGESSYTTAAEQSCTWSNTEVYVKYIPNPTSGSDLTKGKVSLYLGGCSVLSALVDKDKIFNMWSPYAYIGFTGGVSGSDSFNLQISQWALEYRQATGAYSQLVQSGILFAQYGQHDTYGSATTTEFTRLTDYITSTYVSSGSLSIPQSTSFAGMDPYTTAVTTQLEIVYFSNETAFTSTTSANAANQISAEVSAQLEYSAYPTGASKPIEPASSRSRAHYVIPLDGCGDPVSDVNGLNAAASVTNGGEFYNTNNVLSCTNSRKVHVVSASYQGYDVTSSVRTTCDGQTSCTVTLSGLYDDPNKATWETGVFGAVYGCYDQQAPSIISESSYTVGLDASNFGFYQTAVGAHLQQRYSGEYSTDIKFNGDSIGLFNSMVTYAQTAPSQCSFTTIGTLNAGTYTLTAGQAYTMTISALDTFGNAVNDSSTVFTVSFSKSSSTFTSTHVSGNTFSVSITLTDAVSSMQMLVTTNSQNIASSPDTVAVVASTATDAFMSVATTLVATNSGGVTATLSLTDAYGNSVTTGTYDVRAVIVGVNTYATTTFQTSGSISGSVAIANIRHNVVGAYVVQYYIGGNLLSTTSSLTITASTEHVPSFTVTGTSAYTVGGDANYHIVQTKDEFGNVRSSALSGTFTVNYDAPSGADPSFTCPSADCVYESQGRYRVTFVPTVSGSWSLSMTGSTGSTGSTSFTVNPGALSTISELEVVDFSRQANQEGTFRVTAKDSSGNIRDHVTNDGSNFLIVIDHLSSSNVATVVSVGTGSNGVYTVTWKAAFTQCAGDFLIGVSLTAGGSIANTTTRTVNVIAGATTQVGSVSGPGIGSILAGTDTFFRFTALDAYGNEQLSSVSDTFTLDIVGKTGTNPSVAVESGAVYLANYTVPTHVSATPQFQIQVTLSPSTVVLDLEATTLESDTSENGAQLQSAPATMDPDVPTTLTILNRNFDGTERTGVRTFFVDFEQSGVVQNAITPSCTTTSSVSQCDVTVNSLTTKHVTAVGTYTIKIRVGENNYSPSNYSTNVVTGTPASSASSTTLSASSAVAGTSINAESQLYDSYGNLYTSGALSVTFTVTQSTDASGQCSVSSPCTLTGVWDSGANKYVAAFTPTLATTFSILGFHNSIELGTSQELAVTPAAASAAQSSLSDLSKPYTFFVVDYEISSELTLRDQYNNKIPGETVSGGFSFTPSLTSNTVTFTITETTNPGVYKITCIPTVSSVYAADGTASNLDYSVQISSAHVSGSPKSIAVQPGDVSPSTSSITMIPDSYTVGEYITLNMTMKDANSNNWKQSTTLVRVTVTTPTSTADSGSFGAGQTFLQPLALGDGMFMYQIKVTQGNVHAAFKVEIISAIFSAYTVINIPGISNQTYMLPSSASAAQTITSKALSLSLTDSTVGTSPFGSNFTGYTVIQLFDEFGNNRFANATGNATVTVRFDGHRMNDYIDSTMPSAFICTQGQDYTANMANFEITSGLTSSVNCDNTTGICTITATGTVAGNFRMLIFVNDVGAECTQFTVTPGEANAAMSTSYAGLMNSEGTCVALDANTRLTQTVGAMHCVVVALTDSFGNRISSNTTGTVAVAPPTIGSVSCTDTIIAAGSDFTMEPATYEGLGMYLIQFRSQKTGSFAAVATIRGVAVGADNTAACNQITFTPWYVHSFRPTISAITTVASVPSSIYIVSFDTYNNNITTGTHFYSMTMSHMTRDYKLTVASSTALSVNQRLDYTPEWAGQYSLTVTLIPASKYTDGSFTRSTSGLQNGFNYQTNVTVNPVTCASLTSGNTPYRCSDDPTSGTCVSSYSNCGGGVTLCPSSAPVHCAGVGCVSNSSACPCSVTGMTRCASGICVNDEAECIEKNLVCPAGTVNCQSVEGSAFPSCAPSATDCPSIPVCPPGTSICDDGVSCAASTSDCGSVSVFQNCSSGEFKCGDGRCVESIFDCPSRKSCGASEAGTRRVICADGSCADAPGACPSIYKCYGGKIRCSDGTCAATLSECPSQPSCPTGYVLCENGKCAKSQSVCKEANTCANTEIRCGDGSCAANVDLCPTGVKCAGVWCDDGTCADSVEKCPIPYSLNDCNLAHGLSTLKTCPGGACASEFSHCPTSVTCPANSPVKCPDGSCQSNSTICSTHQRETCPTNKPVRCPNGECRFNLNECPTLSRCPAGRPVRCEDGSCASARSSCEVLPSLMTCPSNFVRCPHTGCAPSFHDCPTVLTCAKNSDGTQLLQRCNDGTCRSDCSSITYQSCTAGQVTCPPSRTGHATCASNLKNCPTYPSCGENRPVACLDATCATDVTFCPKFPDETGADAYTKIPCADGGYALKASQCGTPVTCTLDAPHKCADQTCRARKEDCVSYNEKCPETSGYSCPNGRCEADIQDCPSSPKCSKSSAPTKCAAINTTSSGYDIFGCAPSVDSCAPGFQSSTNNLNLVISCPNQWNHCRDTSCVDAQSSCMATACPKHIPYLCEDGLCARTKSACNEVNGCPHDRPYKCESGQCVARATSADGTSACTQPATNCSSTQVRCPDGSCGADGSCPEADGCATGYLRCNDGSCVNYDPSQTGLINYCITGSRQNQYHNECPNETPYRCPGGKCAKTKANCPKDTYGKAAKTCAAVETYSPPELQDGLGTYAARAHPVMCSDGSCVASEAQCPIVAPCPQGYSRCGDGACKPEASRCPAVNTCPDKLSYRCSDGSCAPSLKFCVSPTSVTGCPCATNGWDSSNEYCNTEQVKCMGSTLGGLCGANKESCFTQQSNYLLANGCNSTLPHKCWNGKCVADITSCPLPNGCPTASPAKCLDGTCRANATACQGVTAASGAETCADGTQWSLSQVSSRLTCKSYLGCDITTPYRCGDGSCKKYFAFQVSASLPAETQSQITSDVLSQACTPTVVCPSHKPHRCADYSCADVPGKCPPTFACANTTAQYICPDMSCASDASACAQTSGCPEGSPVLCDDGSCREDVSYCEAEAEDVAPVCADGQVLCFDLKCRASTSACQRFQYLISHPSATDFPYSTLDATKDICATEGSTEMAVCPDGSCVPSVQAYSLCAPTPGCPSSMPHRCKSGACVATEAECGSNERTCENGLNLCASGVCSSKCVGFNGCAGKTPFYCPTATGSNPRFCVATAAECTAQSQSQSLSRLSFISTETETDTERESEQQEVLDEVQVLSSSKIPPTCTEDCNRDVPVLSRVIELGNADETVNIAVSAIDLSVRGRLVIPAGAIGANSNNQTVIEVQEVSDDELRSAINYVHRSRQGDFSVNDNLFTMEQTVLSAAFKCSASQDPFNLKIGYNALVDNSDLINPGLAEKKRHLSRSHLQGFPVLCVHRSIRSRQERKPHHQHLRDALRRQRDGILPQLQRCQWGAANLCFRTCPCPVVGEPG